MLATGGRWALLLLLAAAIGLALVYVLEPPALARRGAAPARPIAEPSPGDAADPVPPEAPVVPEGPAIRGIVRDALGPVAGAVVSATDRYDGTRLGETRTAADGTFAVGPVEGFVGIAAEDPQRGIAVGEGQPGDFLELRLLPGAAVTGVVRARETGLPLPGARIHVLLRAATTDAEGRYALRNLPSSWAQVVAVADGYRQARRSLSVAPGESRNVDFLLERGGRLQGIVTDAATGAPVAGAEVSERADRYGSLAARGGADRRARTDAEGRYVLDGVAAEENRAFFCVAAGHVAAERESDGSGRLDFALARPLAASGLVVDPDGRPVPDAKVFLHRVSQAGGSLFLGKPRSQHACTDAQGRFRFEDVAPGTVAFVALAEGFAPGETVARDAGNLADVTVRLARGLSLDIAVRDANGLGVEGATVNTTTPAGPGDRFGPPYASWGRSLRTDGTGRVRIDGLVAGDFAVIARHPQRGTAHTKVSGSAGETVPLELHLGGLEITGRVVTARGEPAAGAHVSAFASTHSERAQADGLGRFRLAGLPAGAFRVGATGAHAASDFIEVAAGTQGVELRLASQLLRGTVRGAGGGPLGAFSVSAVRRTPRTNTTFEVEGGDGSFEEPVPPGAYRLTARAPGHRSSVARDVVVQAGIDPPPLDFVLEPAATVRGTARGRDGRPLAYVWVSATPTKAEGGAQGGNDRTDQEGRYVIDGVGPGEYAIVLTTEREGTSRTPATIPATGEVSIDLRIGPTGTAVVRVVDDEGKPVPRAYVTFAYADHGALAGESGLTDVEGTLASGPLPAEVPLVARAQVGDARAEARFSVPPWNRAEIGLALPK